MQQQPDSQATCWTMIQGAAEGNDVQRSDFAQRYLPIVRAFFSLRWKRSALAEQTDDAVQEVFLECFRQQGALEKVVKGRANGFRAFLRGIVNNVAMRAERTQARHLKRKDPASFHPEELEADNERLSKLFDRSWAVSLIKQAGELQERRARESDEAARQRVLLLRLRFEDDLPIREIAERWGQDAAQVHEAYRRARQEFRTCLNDVVVFHSPGASDKSEQECERLLALIK